jgi:hypothetical protein
MSTAKFERLIDLIINEDQERAEQLFHEIVVEKSREIYENIIDEDMTTDFIDEISSEEQGMDDMMEDDEEFIDDEEIDGDYGVDEEDVEYDDEDEDFGDEEIDFDLEIDDDGEEEELEDRVVDLEDKLDELMAEFESMMNDSEEDVDVDVDVEDEVVDEGKRSRQEREGLKDLRKSKEMRRYAADDFDKVDEATKAKQEREGLKDLRKSKDERRQAAKDFDKVDKVAEATEMKKVPVTHHDGSDKSAERSPVDFNSGQKGMASHPVDFDMGGDLQQANGPKKPSNYGTKGEGEVKGAASFKNKIGGDAATGKGRGESTPKPVNKQPAGGDQRSPVPESRRNTRRKV